MRVCKCALKLVLRHPIYFLIYGLWLSLMGVFMASSLAAVENTDEYTPYELEYAVIDHDSGPVADGICDFLETQGTRVPLEDTTFAIQDAVAKGEADYVLTIPEGYGERLMRAAETGEEAPRMECIYSFYSADGALMDAALAEYVSLLYASATAVPDATPEGVVSLANASAAADAPVKIVHTPSDASASDRFVFYLQFDMYVYFAGIIVCVGMMLVVLGRADVRRRNLASPVSYLGYSMQTALASVVVMIVFWVFTFVLGIICFPASFEAISLAGKLTMALVTLVFACIPLSVAYLLGQLGVGETILNALGNILGLVLSFLGGAWVPMDIMGPEVLALARFLPGYWYTDALSRAGSMESFGGDALAAIGCDLGVIALFAAAVFGVAIVVGRLRTQTAESGGNAAAEAAAL